MRKLLLFLFSLVVLSGCEDFFNSGPKIFVYVGEGGQIPQSYSITIYRDDQFLLGDEFDREYVSHDYYTTVGNAQPGMYYFKIEARSFANYYDGIIRKTDSLYLSNFNKTVYLDISE